VQEAIFWLENHWDRKRPFCLFVWFHAPLAVGQEFIDMYKGRKEVAYFGVVTQLDYEFGRLMKTLDKMRLRDERRLATTTSSSIKVKPAADGPFPRAVE